VLVIHFCHGFIERIQTLWFYCDSFPSNPSCDTSGMMLDNQNGVSAFLNIATDTDTHVQQFKELQDGVQRELQDCTKKKEELQIRRRRRHGPLRKTDRLERFCKKMSELLETFSGTADVAKAIDSRVGGALIGALSMLFQVSDVANVAVAILFLFCR
jgi:hypothetical protein